MKFENENPTETEKLLFKYNGLYLVEKKVHSLRYAPVHTDNNCEEFPYVLENIEEKMIEWDGAIVFDVMSETVSIHSYYDIDTLALIVRRMEELGFKRTYT